MCGQVGGTGLIQCVVAPVPLERLQGVAEARLLMAEVDDEGRAVIGNDACGKGARECLPRRRAFDDGAGRCAPEAGLDGDGCGGGEAERLGRGRKRDGAFLPGAVHSLELPDRQRVEELVGNDQRRARGHGLEPLVPRRAGVGEPGGLLLAQALARLDEVQVDGGTKVRHDPHGAQRIGQESAATRAKLHEVHPLWLAHGLPHRRAPEADQLAEHLAHLGRGDEVPAGADGPPAPVIAVGGMVEAKLHVGGDADWSVAPDPLPYFVR